MKVVNPKVFFIAETKVVDRGMQLFLDHVGAGDWKTDAPSDAERLAEVAGRSCYRSFDPDLNPNLTEVREGNQPYVANILQKKHGSVLEHSSVTFAFCDVSRVFTHELVRHRAGMAYSQESLRFVRLTVLDARYPEAFEEKTLGELYDGLQKAGKVPADGRGKEEWVEDRVSMLHDHFTGTFEHLEKVQQTISAELYLDDLPKSFRTKKVITSAMRRMAPIGLATFIIATGNHRAWRHQIAVRTAAGAEEEIREVFAQVAGIMKEEFPNIYQDMQEQGDGSFAFENEKV
jgi:thymidylate synthase (FAD)